MSNRRYWDQFNKPPKTALRPISGGRLNGKTDVNPEWRYQAMTEVFGPIGEGWKYTIDKLWTEPGTDGQICAFAMVSVQYVIHDIATVEAARWSAPIPGIGGSMLVEKERSGMHTSDEAYKMAVTDALSVALKALGVAAEVYLGNWDGSKFINQPASADDIPRFLTVDQRKQIKATYEKAGHPQDVVKSWLKAKFGVDSTGEVKQNDLPAILKRLADSSPLGDA